MNIHIVGLETEKKTKINYGFHGMKNNKKAKINELKQQFNVGDSTTSSGRPFHMLTVRKPKKFALSFVL